MPAQSVAKTSIITGASQGIGLAVALRFARRGWNVVAAARREADLVAAAGEVRAAGGTCEPVSVDVSRPADVRRLIETARGRFGRVDVLVNNAGVAPLAAIEELDSAAFDQLLAVNVAAVFHATQAVWPVMRAQGGGVIVNISSLASVDPFPGFAAYGASKAWVNLFSQALGAEGRAAGIRVFAVAPGAVETRLMRSAFPDFPGERALAPDDVAAVIESVCDERMAAAAGQTVFVRK